MCVIFAVLTLEGKLPWQKLLLQIARIMLARTVKFLEQTSIGSSLALAVFVFSVFITDYSSSNVFERRLKDIPQLTLPKYL